jgi:hypothetical protein
MKRLIPLLAVTAVLAAPAAASAAGVVLKVDQAHHLAAVTHGSQVALVHTSAAAHLRVGQQVAMTTRKLANGTLAASGLRVLGRAHRATFRGFLLSHTPGRLVLTAGGAVIKTGAPPAAVTATPGSEVSVTVTVQNGELDADDVNIVSATAPGGRIEGKLAAIGTTTITVVSEHLALVLNVPAGTDLSTLTVGDEVLATFAQQADGTLLLTALSADDTVAGADGEDHHGHGDGNGDGNGHDGHDGSGSGSGGSGSGGGSGH